MYTGTIFNWHDNSGFNVGTEVVDTTNRPLFMVVNSFDKGPEKLMEVDATTFNALYGTMSYDRHGQGSIQAQKIIDAGGRLLIKRVCAADSGLANSVFVATIDEDGKLSWEIKSIDTVGESAPKTFAEVKKAAYDAFFNDENHIYPLFVITDIGRGESIKATRVIPDYDTSRGLEKMIYKFNIYEGTTLMESANISFDPTYQFNGEYYGLDKNRMTQVTAEVIPEVYNAYLEYITGLVFADDIGTDKFKDDMAIVSGFDLINACTYKADKIYKNNKPTGKDSDVVLRMKMKADGKTLDGDSLDVAYGNRFKYIGSYGSYGKSPAKFGNEHNVYDFFNDGINEAQFAEDNFIKTPLESSDPVFENKDDKYNDYIAYRQLVIDIANVYFGYDTDGKFIDEVWDVDTHKLFAVMDANYHKWIKDAMANFVEFRKDCIFFRDSGIGFYSVHDAQEVYTKYTLDSALYVDKFEEYVKDEEDGGNYPFTIIDSVMAISDLRSRFIADYGTTFEVVDPTTKKNIEVTMLYDMAEKLTELYITQGPFAPLAGTYNGFELDAAIDGTINFTPIITPTANQKQAIDDIRLNYAIFEQEDQCVVQSNYTSQDMNTQLSFINNVLAIQEVARVVRTVCPRTRFRLITGSDMSEYANAVSRVLQGYTAYFETLEFQYTEDPLRSIQKIFYASINFSFNNWAQTEIFDLYALANTTTTSNNS